METRNFTRDERVTCTDCVTGKSMELVLSRGEVTSIIERETKAGNDLFMGPGLVDLQINGVNGIDFNNPALTKNEVINATHFLLQNGITTFLPTVITNSDANTCKIVDTIHQACLSDALVNDCIWGIHLEGPFISATTGAKGAHDEKYISPPNWQLFQKYQRAAGGKIKLLTIAPELDGAGAFIEKCSEHKILVSIGHSMANSQQIRRAVDSGACLATHLGNAVPLMLPRHPNILWDLLAEEDLYTCIIADGIHIPDSFIKVVLKNKAEKTLVVSDATCFAGMEPGEYQNHIGGIVILDNEKRVALKSTPGLLAGAAKTLLESVETLINHQISTIGRSWQMASSNVVGLLSGKDDTFDSSKDLVIFRFSGEKIQIETVIKKGKVVFER
ncbi:MAG: N-acetylglucosamine-6-phosphate deacetylase [Bacteroidota bacterium]|nr:N-acetylglucosamine-6-phosphate deacetylase [Bacteroidota bacterium]